MGSLSKAFFEWPTSTVYLNATNIVLLIVSTLIKMICVKNLGKATAQECKKSSSGWCESLENIRAIYTRKNKTRLT